MGSHALDQIDETRTEQRTFTIRKVGEGQCQLTGDPRRVFNHKERTGYWGKRQDFDPTAHRSLQRQLAMFSNRCELCASSSCNVDPPIGTKLLSLRIEVPPLRRPLFSTHSVADANYPKIAAF
jgi:hypothetical protein